MNAFWMQDEETVSSEELQVNSFLGLFLVLGVGCALGVVGSCAEMAVRAVRRPRYPARTFAANFASELRFVFRFEQSVKPLLGPLTASPAPSSSAAASPRSAGSDPPLGEEEDEEEASPGNARRESAQTAGGSGWARRRSSMHTASARLARHAARASTPHHP